MRTRLPHLTGSFVALAVLATACSNVATSENPGETAAPPGVPAGASAPVPLTQVQWRRAMSKEPTPAQGCFRASQPDMKWQEVPCVTALTGPRPLPQRLRSAAPRAVGAPRAAGTLVPETVGGGGSGDDMAQVSGLLTWVEGSFPLESGGGDESDNSSDASNPGANSYSLQMNTNTFSSPACNPSPNFSCQGWQQFVYDPQEQQLSMQYWLLDYTANCPDGWNSSNASGAPDCYVNSPAITVPAEPASNLANTSIVASTSAATGTDTVTMTVSGTAYVLSVPTTLTLSGGWNAVEFNVFGEDNSTLASFGSPTTLEVQVLTESATPTRAAPFCPQQSTTGETSSMSLISLPGHPGQSCCAFGGDSPGIQFREDTNPAATAPACPALTATPSPNSIPAGSEGTTTLSVVGNLVGQSGNASLQPASCTVEGPVPATQNPGFTGQQFFLNVPWSEATGSTLVDDATCDISPDFLGIPITVGAPIFTVSPNPVVVQQGYCAEFQPELNVSPDDLPVSVGATSDGPLPTGVTLDGGGAVIDGMEPFFGVCATSSASLGSFNLTVTSYGDSLAAQNTTGVTVEVVPCVPITESMACTSAYEACGPVSDGCGGTYDCTCSGETSCSNGVCCAAGMTGFVDVCCPTGTEPCEARDFECMTATACEEASKAPPKGCKGATCS
jgi:hypothetical protein